MRRYANDAAEFQNIYVSFQYKAVIVLPLILIQTGMSKQCRPRLDAVERLHWLPFIQQ